MFLPASALSTSHTPDPIAIIGAGAAGIALGLRLKENGVPALILESGGFEVSPVANALNNGTASGQPYFPLEATRVRCFGGSTQHWGGWCEPIDDEVFEPRPGLPNWPIAPAELAPFLEQAAEFLHLDLNCGSRSFVTDTLGLSLLPLSDYGIENRILNVAPWPHLGRLYRTDFGESELLRVVLGATVTRLHCRAHERDDVIDMMIRRVDGTTVRLSARQVVIATGGIEAARLLLASETAVSPRMGPTIKSVGQGFSEHLHAPLGWFRLSDKHDLRAYAERPHQGGRIGEGCVIAALRLSFDALGTDVPFPVVAKVFIEHRLGNLYDLFGVWEQVPTRESFVSLSDRLDQYGGPKAHLHWCITDQDLLNGLAACRLVATALTAAGFGEAGLFYENVAELRTSDRLTGGHHHLGTTRMAKTPSAGVTDPHGRVFGLNCVTIVGGSLFPCPGSAPPTLTVVALALRAADRLAAQIK